MCGIAGFLDLSRSRSGDESTRLIKAMTDSIRYRGPDDSGAWVDETVGVGLGQRRLSIVDLSPEGHQPMIGGDGRYVIVFNGEVYNFAALRQELEPRGYAFRGHSDTEVILAAVSHWGVAQAVQRFVGMFAFALWDRQDQRMYLVRDRLGIKPLYYGWSGNTLLFGSELKALAAHPSFAPQINRNALALFLRHNYIPAPYSIYDGVYKLPPATILAVEPGRERECEPVAYWSARQVAEQGVSRPFTGSPEDALAELEAVLKDSIKLRMVADVPLGAFLSGGIDSSTVVALMQAQSSRSVRTFSIGFNEAGYNEAQHAKAVAQHLGTDHTELYVTPQEAMAVIPQLSTMYDEPFADSSQIPTHLVAALARRQVTVALSGDGGDELFAGYSRYQWGRDLWRSVGWMPRGLRGSTARGLTAISPQAWERFFNSVSAVLPRRLRQTMPGDKMHKLAEILAAETPEQIYLGLISHWKDPTAVALNSLEPPTVLTEASQRPQLADFTSRMMYLDTVTYLPDDILTKVDRASMAVSLEARVPLLDHRVMEFAWRLPMSLKIRDGKTKWLLRQVLYKYVPEQLVERPKMGFGVPIADWLRGPLRDWAESLLNQSRLEREGFFNPVPIRQKWDEHLSGRRNWQYYLWDILMFQSWLESSREPLTSKG